MIVSLLANNINSDDLEHWPVCWGVPLPMGALTNEQSLVLHRQNGSPYPVQSRALAHHPDGSIRRLLLHSEVDLPADQEQQFQLETGSAPIVGEPARILPDGIEGALGAIRLVEGQLSLYRGNQTFELNIEAAGRPGAASTGEVLTCMWTDLRPVNEGPIAASVDVVGRLIYKDQVFAAITLSLHLFGQTPTLDVNFRLSNEGEFDTIDLDHLYLTLQSSQPQWRQLDYELRHLVAQGQSDLPFEARSNDLIIEAGSLKHDSRLMSYNETWISLKGATEQCVIAIPDFLELYPYGVSLTESQITLACWPDWHNTPWSLPRGVGKTHRFSIGFFPENQEDIARAFGYASTKRPLTRVAWHDLQNGGVLTDLLDYDPDKYPRIESTLYDITHNRNTGFGKMNYGDDYSPLYTNQGRGKGKIVWNNLEGDYPFHMFCQYQRTGQYLYYKEFMNGLLHWSDVDFADHIGALVTHSADHHTGQCSPCHNWAESIREWYYLTGDPRPLDMLTKMAAWLLAQDASHSFTMQPEPYVRGCGWGLIQLAAIQEVLNREDLRSLILSIGSNLLDYFKQHDGLVMTIPTGGNHVPKDNAFHSATVVMGAERCWRLLNEPVLRELALAVAEVFMDRRTCSPEGIAVYISGPEQDFPMQQAATFAMAALATAYRLDPQERFARRGMRMLEYCMDRGMIVDHMRIPGEFMEQDGNIILSPQLLTPNTQLSSYQLRGLLLFMKTAHEASMLKRVDYVF